jgi:hypothetical protein
MFWLSYCMERYHSPTLPANRAAHNFKSPVTSDLNLPVTRTAAVMNATAQSQFF